MTTTIKPHHLTIKILIGMLCGMAVGLILKYIPSSEFTETYIVSGFLHIGGTVFITLLKLLVVPIVFISLVCGTSSLSNPGKLGRLGIKTLLLYTFTTALAISLGITFASLFHIGAGNHFTTPTTFQPKAIPSLTQTFINMFPSNPIAALASGNMLQIIVFSMLFGIAIAFSGNAGKRIANFFQDLNEVVMRLIMIIMKIAPYGVFCLIAGLFAKIGFDLIAQLFGYFATVMLALLVHLVVSNSLILKIIGRLNPLAFFRKMYSAMLFAFSTASSNASIPIVMETVKDKLGVNNTVASFVIPLGATINMDGTAIMQGVATVFIANSYGIHLGLTGYLMVIISATLASIGTAGVPSVGLITLAMVLRQVGLPVEGIALIIGVDRLLDMVRTAVNITGDSAVACVVAQSEQALDKTTYQQRQET